jgi:hypothetical protein
VIGHLKGRLRLLQKEMKARKHPVRRWGSRALTLIRRLSLPLHQVENKSQTRRLG